MADKPTPGSGKRADEIPLSRRPPLRSPQESPLPEPTGRIVGEPDPNYERRLAEEAQIRADREAARIGPPPVIVGVDATRLNNLLAEIAKRKIESIRLYEPIVKQEEFHRSKSRIRLLIGPNRCGKTEAGSFELGRAATGNDPYGKFPKVDGRYICVGKDLDHIGKVLYDKLMRAGAIRIIRDEQTQQWRNFRPWQEYDAAYIEKAKPAPPMIPPRFIKKIAWENKAKNIPSLIVLHNGSEIALYSSLGKPPQGVRVHGVYFDEEIVDEDWFPEMRMRLLDYKGRLWWSATPQLGGDALYELHEKAEEQAHDEIPGIAEWALAITENPYIDKAEIKAARADLSEEQAAVRLDGDFAVEGFKVYPSFNMYTHGVDPFPIPEDWTHYAVVDPGHQVCAILYAAVPPPDQGDFVYLYDESYIKECDASRFAEAMRQKTSGRRFYAFIMDYHYGIHTDAGTGRNTMQQYSEALRQVNVSSITTGDSFRLASDDIDAGVTAVRGWLNGRDGAAPKLRVFRGVLPNFEWEIKRYRKQRVGNVILDKPVQRGRTHAMDCLRYLAMSAPKYVRADARDQKPTGAYAAFLAHQKRLNKGGGYVRLGPGRQN